MKRLSKSVSIKRKIRVPVLHFIIFVIIIYTGTLAFSGLFNTLRDNSYKELYFPIKNRTDEIESKMNLIALNTNDTAKEINAEINQTLKERNISVENTKDKAEIDSILNEVLPNIVVITRKINVNAAFVVLNTSIYNDKVHKAGIRIKDNEPGVITNTKGDLFYTKGPSNLADDNKLALDPFWSYEYDFSEDSDGLKNSPQLSFYWKPIIAAKNSKGALPEETGYWSEPYELSKNDTRIITYSVALVDDEGNPYGVMGVDLSTDYMAKMIPSNDITYKNSFYIMGYFDENTYSLDKNWYVSSGNSASRFISLLKNNIIFKPAEENNIYGIYSFDTKDKYFKTILAKPEKLNIYGLQSQYKDKSWYLIGFAPEREVRAPVKITINAILLSILLTFIIGLCTLLYTSWKITEPITKLALGVKKLKLNKPIVLDKVGIREIDDLAYAVEDATAEVTAAAARLFRTIDLVDVRLGSFEHNLKTNTVFLTDSLFKLLEIPVEGENYISIGKWRQIFNYSYNEPEVLYVPKNSENAKWLRIKVAYTEESILGIVLDITEEVNERKKLEKERDFDVLTGLYNRRAFQNLVSERLKNRPQDIGALIFLDLDNLKYINDVYGHDVGDKYIKCAADNMKKLSNLNCICSRISGDEFAIYVHGDSPREELYNNIHNMVNEFNTAFRLPDNSVQKIRASFGVAYYPEDADNFNDLIKFADFAMYEVKHSFKGTIKEFEKSSYERNYYLLDKKEALNKLIDKKLVCFHFQPIVDINTAEIFAYEALMRPTCEDFKTPYEILTLAKADAKLYEIEKLTFFGVLEYVNEHLDNIGVKKIFFNSISNQCLLDVDRKIIEAKYINIISSAVVELTEEEEINKGNKESLIKFLEENGGQLAIDDFGAGYSNESSLLKVAPQYVKIDMYLVRDIDRDKNKQQLVANIIKYAKDNNIKTIAEGVETYEEMKTVISLKVDLLQGFYLGKPNKELNDIPERIKNEIKAVSSQYS